MVVHALLFNWIALQKYFTSNTNTCKINFKKGILPSSEWGYKLKFEQRKDHYVLNGTVYCLCLLVAKCMARFTRWSKGKCGTFCHDDGQ